jgi:hypothetical protein
MHDPSNVNTPSEWPPLACIVSALRRRLKPLAPALIGTASVLALLLAFGQVVTLSVQNGQARHRASAERDDAAWRCNAQRSATQRADCRAQPEAARARPPH